MKPFDFQNMNQERIIHSKWDKGNSYRHLLEGAGDIFRELTKESVDWEYISSKIERIDLYFALLSQFDSSNTTDSFIERMQEEYGLSPLDTGIHPADSYEYAYANNTLKFKALVALWSAQPNHNMVQYIAVVLNVALLENRVADANRMLGQIKLYRDARLSEII